MSSIFDPKICIVSLIGKSQLMPNESKAWKLNSILHKSAFQVSIIKSNRFSSLLINHFHLDGYK